MGGSARVNLEGQWMGARTKHLGVAGLAAWLAVAGGHGAARAEDRKQACLDASSQGQTLRDERKLIEARAAFQKCSDVACPGVVRKDCEAWFERAQADVPSVALEPKDAAGKDVLDAKVAIDGVAVAPAQLDGRSIELNPGMHLVRFELPDGTAAEEQALLHEGDKNHIVTAVLGHPAALASGPGSSTTMAASPPAGASPLRTAGLVVGGVGVAALVVGGIFGLEAISKQNDADCPNNVCKDQGHLDTLSSARSAATASTLLVVGGAVLTGAGVTLWLLAPRGPRTDRGRLGITPTVGRGFDAVTLRGAW